MSKPKAIVLLSGGLDSATTLAIAIDTGFDCFCLSFGYGQKHAAELNFAKGLCANFGTKHQTIHLDTGVFSGSALTDDTIDVPVDGKSIGIPVTYVPARNTVFLAYALGYAEILSTHDIFIGVNAVDYSGYPDCRPEFIFAFEKMANLATKMGVDGQAVNIHTPLIALKKAAIIRKGIELGVDYSKTASCYQLTESGLACGACDSCRIRRLGFAEAGVDDPTCYIEN